jgi:hypothetical protein
MGIVVVPPGSFVELEAQIHGISTMSDDAFTRIATKRITELRWRAQRSQNVDDHRIHRDDVSKVSRMDPRLISLKLQTVGPQLSTVVPCGDAPQNRQRVTVCLTVVDKEPETSWPCP